jgi:hypothetical protein
MMIQVDGEKMMRDGQTEVVLLWETRAMSKQNLLVLAGSVPAGSAPAGGAPALNRYSRGGCRMQELEARCKVAPTNAEAHTYIQELKPIIVIMGCCL